MDSEEKPVIKNREVKLELLTDLIDRKEKARVMSFQSFSKVEDNDEFTNEVVGELNKTLRQHRSSLDNLIDRVISHLAE